MFPLNASKSTKLANYIYKIPQFHTEMRINTFTSLVRGIFSFKFNEAAQRCYYILPVIVLGSSSMSNAKFGRMKLITAKGAALVSMFRTEIVLSCMFGRMS